MATAILLAALPTAAHADDVSDAGSEAFAQVAGCAAQSDTVLAAIVVDASGSLRYTDPDDQRVGAIETAIDSLVSLAAADENATVEASLATFAASYEQHVGWGDVAGDHADALRSEARQTLPQREDGAYTDYRAALQDAQSSLNDRAAQLDGSTCKLMLWFTDGGLDVQDAAGDGTATEDAFQSMCTPNGIVDGVRADGIAVIALALFTQDGEGSVTEQDRLRLQAIAEGTGGAETCGTAPIPAGAAIGAYLAASNVDALRATFAQAGALIEQGSLGTTIDCTGDACTDESFDFPVDRGVSRVRLVLDQDLGDSATLTGPSGDAAALAAGEAALGTAAITVARNEGLTTVDIALPQDDEAVGEWSLALGAGVAPSQVSAFYFWDATVAIVGPETGLLVGEPSIVSVAFLSKGLPIDTSVYGSLDVAATLDGEPLALTPTESGAYEATITPTGDEVPATLALHVEATATTASGTALAAVYGHADLPTAIPSGFPTVETATLDFPALTGTRESTATLTIRGADAGATSACVAPVAADQAPQGAGAVTVAADPECLDLGPGEQGTIALTLRSAAVADGLAAGTFVVELRGAGTDEVRTTPVAFSATFAQASTGAGGVGVLAALGVLALLGAALGGWILVRRRRPGAPDVPAEPADGDPVDGDTVPGGERPAKDKRKRRPRHAPAALPLPATPGGPASGDVFEPEDDSPVRQDQFFSYPFTGPRDEDPVQPLRPASARRAPTAAWPADQVPDHGPSPARRSTDAEGPAEQAQPTKGAARPTDEPIEPAEDAPLPTDDDPVPARD